MNILALYKLLLAKELREHSEVRRDLVSYG